MCSIEILRAEGAECRTLHGLCDGSPIVVTLDCSATMRLLEDRRTRLEPLEPRTLAKIVKATERIVDSERNLPSKIVVSALDLD